MQPISPKPSPSAQTSPPHNTLPVAKQDKESSTASTTAKQQDTVSTSTAGQEISQYIETMAELPDIRKKRITQIQAALESGTYSVSSQDLADKLIQDLST